MKKENSKEKIKRLLLIVLLLALIIFLLIFFFYFYLTKEESSGTLKTSLNQVKIVSDEKRQKIQNKDEVTLQDFGTLQINKYYSYVCLKNLKENNVYLKYDVYLDSECLYQTDLIEPGMMEKYEVYDVLGFSGEYELEYHISLYDLKTKQKLPSTYKMKQTIVIG